MVKYNETFCNLTETYKKTCELMNDILLKEGKSETFKRLGEIAELELANQIDFVGSYCETPNKQDIIDELFKQGNELAAKLSEPKKR